MLAGPQARSQPQSPPGHALGVVAFWVQHKQGSRRDCVAVGTAGWGSTNPKASCVDPCRQEKGRDRAGGRDANSLPSEEGRITS